MKDEFYLKEIKNNLYNELESIGFDKSYLHKGIDKYQYKNLKIFNLTIPQANILKQTAISVGADCAVHRETITAKVEKTNCILGGSISQLKKIAHKLSFQPFSLKKLAGHIEEILNYRKPEIKIKETLFDFSRPYIVGVLNITQNSFSDGGLFYDIEHAKNHLMELINDGADIIEIGAESTKAFSKEISAEDQLEKLIPILKFIKEKDIKTPISIDTRNAKVAKECILAGANIINDVSGFEHDTEMITTLAELNVPVIIQHSKGTPENMQINPEYSNLMDEIFYSLKEKINIAISAGIKKENIIIDPGIGFGKTNEHNFEILNRVEELETLNVPIMLGISRKSMLNLNQEPNEIKDIYTLALNAIAIKNNVNFLRVHNVKMHKQLLNYKIF